MSSDGAFFVQCNYVLPQRLIHSVRFYFHIAQEKAQVLGFNMCSKKSNIILLCEVTIQESTIFLLPKPLNLKSPHYAPNSFLRFTALSPSAALISTASSSSSSSSITITFLFASPLFRSLGVGSSIPSSLTLLALVKRSSKSFRFSNPRNKRSQSPAISPTVCSTLSMRSPRLSWISKSRFCL